MDEPAQGPACTPWAGLDMDMDELERIGSALEKGLVRLGEGIGKGLEQAGTGLGTGLGTGFRSGLQAQSWGIFASSGVIAHAWVASSCINNMARVTWRLDGGINRTRNARRATNVKVRVDHATRRIIRRRTPLRLATQGACILIQC